MKCRGVNIKLLLAIILTHPHCKQYHDDVKTVLDHLGFVGPIISGQNKPQRIMG